MLAPRVCDLPLPSYNAKRGKKRDFLLPWPCNADSRGQRDPTQFFMAFQGKNRKKILRTQKVAERHFRFKQTAIKNTSCAPILKRTTDSESAEKIESEIID